MKKIALFAKRMAESEKVVAPYAMVSLLFMMLVATTEDITLILLALINLCFSVWLLTRLEK